MTVLGGPLTDRALYDRGATTLLACWEAIARGSRDAAVWRLPGVAAAVFPHEPERAVYNNALLDRGLGAAARAGALDAMEDAYASAGVAHFAAFVHEADRQMGSALMARGYAVTETTRAMGMRLSDLHAPRPRLELAPPEWAGYRRYLAGWGLPAGFYAGVDPEPFHLLLARLDGE